MSKIWEWVRYDNGSDNYTKNIIFEKFQETLHILHCTCAYQILQTNKICKENE